MVSSKSADIGAIFLAVRGGGSMVPGVDRTLSDFAYLTSAMVANFGITCSRPCFGIVVVDLAGARRVTRMCLSSIMLDQPSGTSLCRVGCIGSSPDRFRQDESARAQAALEERLRSLVADALEERAQLQQLLQQHREDRRGRMLGEALRRRCRPMLCGRREQSVDQRSHSCRPHRVASKLLRCSIALCVEVKHFVQRFR